MIPATKTHHPDQVAQDIVRDVTAGHVTDLQEGYCGEKQDPKAVARLAQLRHGAGKLPVDVPELCGAAGLEGLYQQPGFAEDDERRGLRGESAMFLALTLYALHQQSRPDDPMHESGVELGRAVRQLMPAGAIDEPLRRRFVRAGTATNLSVLGERLRGIVALLRQGARRQWGREPIPLDYGLLAARLYQFQIPGGPPRVRTAWGHSFHAYASKPDDSPDTTTDSEDTQ